MKEENSVTIIKGDLITMFKEKKFDAICHGCNCFHIMGAGIALQIANNFPKALKKDKTTLYGSVKKLGSFSTVATQYGKIINLYTQYHPGSNFEYAALIKGLHRINKHYKDLTIGFPFIGAGIGGGEWNIILSLLTSMLPDVNVIIVEYDKGQIDLGFKDLNE